MSEFAKVTVIIETEEQTVTIRAPKAENVQIDEKAVEVIKHESNLGFTTYLNNTMQINVNFLANLDETEGRMYVVETLGKSRPVEPDSTT